MVVQLQRQLKDESSFFLKLKVEKGHKPNQTEYTYACNECEHMYITTSVLNVMHVISIHMNYYCTHKILFLDSLYRIGNCLIILHLKIFPYYSNFLISNICMLVLNIFFKLKFKWIPKSPHHAIIEFKCLVIRSIKMKILPINYFFGFNINYNYE